MCVVNTNIIICDTNKNKLIEVIILSRIINISPCINIHRFLFYTLSFRCSVEVILCVFCEIVINIIYIYCIFDKFRTIIT